MRCSTAVALALLSAVAAAHADEPGPALASHAVSLEVLGLVGNLVNVAVPQGGLGPPPGLEVNGEWFLPNRHWSAVVALGTRWSTAGEDFRSWTLSAGIEGRYWLRLGEIPSMRGLGGPMVGLRLDEALTHVIVQGLGVLDESSTLADTQLSLRAGYRFAFWGRLEITPQLGGAFDEVGAWSWSGIRPELVLNLTAGYLF
jgi:hypothetical protein